MTRLRNIETFRAASESGHNYTFTMPEMPWKRGWRYRLKRGTIRMLSQIATHLKRRKRR